MGQDEQTPRSPSEDEPTRRISLYEEEERTRRLELPSMPPWDTPDQDPDMESGPRGKGGKHVERPSRRWLTAAVAGLLGAVLGVVVTLLVTGAMLQREIAERETRIAQLTTELDQARAELRSVTSQRDQLERREAALDQREASLDARERQLDQREAAPQERIPLPGIDLPGGLGSGILDRFNERIQDLLNEAFPR